MGQRQVWQQRNRRVQPTRVPVEIAAVQLGMAEGQRKFSVTA